MMKFNEFEQLYGEVKNAVDEALLYLQRKSIDYLLFLANGEYKERYETSHLKLNPFTLDNREDKLKDKDRNDFLIEFMRLFYSFEQKDHLEIVSNRIHMELMIYTHTWESKALLKQLYRLAVLADNRLYPWDVKVPNMGKHDFIRYSIRDILKKKDLN